MTKSTRLPTGAMPLDHTRDFRSPSSPSCIKWQWVALLHSTVVLVTTSAARQTPGKPSVLQTPQTLSWLQELGDPSPVVHLDLSLYSATPHKMLEPPFPVGIEFLYVYETPYTSSFLSSCMGSGHHLVKAHVSVSVIL